MLKKKNTPRQQPSGMAYNIKYCIRILHAHLDVGM